MHADAVVEQFDIFEHRGACGVAGFERFIVHQFQLGKRWEKVSGTISAGLVPPFTKTESGSLIEGDAGVPVCADVPAVWRLSLSRPLR